MRELLNRLNAWRDRCQKDSEIDEKLHNQSNLDIGAEHPIKTASEDRFRRNEIAVRIAQVLSELNLNEGRVFSIRGGWGFGKSSLKNLIIEQLNAESRKANWLDFNPWQWVDSHAIARALFGQIADKLGGEYSKKAIERAETLRRYGAMLTGVSSPLKKAGSSSSFLSGILTNVSIVAVASAIGLGLPTAALVASVLAALSVIVSIAGKLLTRLGRDRSGEPLEKVRRSLENRLRELDRPLVVFVDDIDRLEPEQIRMLLRHVKANANLPNIVFVLLFQASIVEHALNPIADNNGRAFLEKIVQANFDLPAVPASIVHRIFLDELSGIAEPYAKEENGFTHTRWGNVSLGCIQPLIRNMRDARRLISSIAIHMPLHLDGHVFEVNIIDFLLLETLRVFEPDLHNELLRKRELLIQENSSSLYDQKGKDWERDAAKSILNLAAEERRDTVQNLLKNLFPTFEWAFGGVSYAHGSQLSWLADRRVCTSRYFPRYFELQTTIGEISERRFIEFLEATAKEDDLNRAIVSLVDDGLMRSLVERLDQSVDRLPVENASILLPVMYEVSEKLAGAKMGAFDVSYASAWRATNNFLRRIPEDARGRLALEALSKSKALSLTSTLIHLSDPANRNEDGGRYFEPALSPDTVAAMKVEWLRLMRGSAANDKELFTKPELISKLYRWGEYAGSMDEPREWFKEVIRTDEGFAAMATLLMNRGTSYSVGDMVSLPHNSFNKENIDDFIGIKEAMARFETINPDNFPEHEEALRLLLRYLEKWQKRANETIEE